MEFYQSIAVASLIFLSTALVFHFSLPYLLLNAEYSLDLHDPPAICETWIGKVPWRRERLPTPVFWPGEFHGLYSPWRRIESDMIE